jgi:archaemetzincin
MPDLEIVAIHFIHKNLIEQILLRLRNQGGFVVGWHKAELDVQDCYDESREQYNALKILQKITHPSASAKTVIYTSLDLYIPIFTFVFGLAGLGGHAAIVSACRLRNEFYGLPGDDNILMARLYKETIHEYGHLRNLRHCSNYQCVMASSSTIDDLDVKGDRFCTNCLSVIAANSR